MMHADHRARLTRALEGGLIVLTAYDAMQLSGDMAAPFVQEANFWWATGIDAPGWKVIIEGSRKHATLVRPKRSDVDIIFNGADEDDAYRETSGISEIIDEKDFEPRLRQLRRTHPMVYALSSRHRDGEFVHNPATRHLEETLKRIFERVVDARPDLARLRAVKSPEEIARIEQAIALTNEAFSAVREKLPTLKTEQVIDAEFTYRFRRAAATHAYEPIVAAGEHACTLHYDKNTGPVHVRDIVLIDIGARVDGYCADITRSYCVRPTKRQRAVHEAVASAQKEIIALIEPNMPTSEYLKFADDIMKKALISLGLLEDSSDEKAYRRYCPHSIGHGLGVDVHDPLGAPRLLEPGMVMTVEPGIYIAEEGIGVRIEDDILVTPEGHRNLSASLPTAL